MEEKLQNNPLSDKRIKNRLILRIIIVTALILGLIVLYYFFRYNQISDINLQELDARTNISIAICGVYDANNFNNYVFPKDTDVGEKYVKKNFYNITSIEGAMEKCQENIFLELMKIYCERNPGSSPEFLVTVHRADYTSAIDSEIMYGAERTCS